MGRPRPRLLPLLAGLPLWSSACGGGVAADEIATGLRFVDVAAEAGIDLVNVCGDPRRWYIPESNGCGAAWLDYDGDGDQDLFVGNGAGLRYLEGGRRLQVLAVASSALYRNDGQLRFTDVTEEAGAARAEWINAVTAADVDQDGDPDLYLACFGRDVFLRNDRGRFVEATEEAGLGNDGWGAGAAFGDLDRDGDLDLYVANYVAFDPDHPPQDGQPMDVDGVLIGWGPEGEAGPGINPGAPDVFFRGDGSGHFQEATAEAGLVLDAPLCSYAVVTSDVDGDLWPDILVANDLQPTNLFMNQGDGTFVEQGLARGFAHDAGGRATAAMGLAVEDFDGDGDMDVLRTNFDLEANCLHVNDGRGHFQDRARLHGLAAPSLDRLGWGGGFLDADCDGDLDILVANGHVLPQAEQIGMHPWAQRSQLFEARPDERVGIVWREVTEASGPGLAPLRSARGVAFGDPDDDGDVDALIVDMDGPPRLLENRSRRAGRWIAVRTVGSESNRDGLGTLVRVHAGGRTWTREVRTTQGLYSSHDPRLHFGLGPVEAVERVELRWPTGRLQVVTAPPLDRLLTVHEAPAPREDPSQRSKSRR